MAFKTNQKRVTTSGKRTVAKYLTRRQADQKARYLLDTNRLSDLALDLVSLLATAGVMTQKQLDELIPMSSRTKQKYQGDGYKLIRWHYVPRDLPQFYPHKSRDRVFSLAEVGCAIARIRNWAADTFEGHNQNHTNHDLLRNHMICHLIEQAQTDGYECNWLGAWESRLYDRKGKPRIEPDGFIKLTKQGQTFPFAMEYHNEYQGRRAEMKIEKYESAKQSKDWTWQWKTKDFPIVLVAYTHSVVPKAYVTALRSRGKHAVKCLYVAKSFKASLDPNKPINQWINLNRNAFDNEKEFYDIWTM